MSEFVAKAKEAVCFRAKCFYQYIWFHTKTWYRRTFEHDRFAKIEELKDKYKGKRCFIIGTGPSLTNEDILKLKDEYTFGVNSIAAAMEELDFYPTFYGFIDAACLDEYGDAIFKNDKSLTFFTRRMNLSKERYKQLKAMKNSYEFLMTEPGSWVTFFHNLPKAFSADPSVQVDWGYTGVYCMMQFIAYMGFSEVYLIGMDCRYAKGVRNFKDQRSDKKIAAGGWNDGGVVDNYIKSYLVAKEYCDAHGIQIYNATRGGYLEVFPRVNLDEVIQ